MATCEPRGRVAKYAAASSGPVGVTGAAHPDLPEHGVPEQDQRGVRVRRELLALGGAGVRVEGQAARGQALEQHGARVRQAVGVDGGDDHRVGLGYPRVRPGLGVPALDPGQRRTGTAGRDVVADQLAVVVQPRGGVDHSSFAHPLSVGAGAPDATSG